METFAKGSYFHIEFLSRPSWGDNMGEHEMITQSIAELRKASPYSAVITREQFLFYETRTTAKLLAEGLTREEATERIVEENLFQYPTEKSVRSMAKTCLQRLDALNDESLIFAIANRPSENRYACTL